MPSLPLVNEIASETSAKTVRLTGMSLTVLFTCLTAANRLADWTGAGYELTPLEIDEIYTILDQARRQLMIGFTGQVIMLAADSAPDGCLLCDGTTYDRVDYPDLYAVLAGGFIVDADHFMVPDLREKFVYGSSPSQAISTTGGEAAHVLTEAELAVHAHSIGGAGTSVAAPGAVPVLTPSIFPSATGSTGSSVAHNNIPPYLTLAFYIVS